MSELKKCKISSAVFQKKLDKDLISDCDYLTYVVKESLRMDPPSMSTSPYYTYEDVEICNVKIPANTNIVLSVCKYSFLIKIVASHYNPEEWHKPKEFIPERFDPCSEYYTKPGTGENLKGYEWI